MLHKLSPNDIIKRNPRRPFLEALCDTKLFAEIIDLVLTLQLLGKGLR